jgi:hypothetical protein
VAIAPRTGTNQTQHLGIIGSAVAVDQDFTFSGLNVGDVLVLLHWRNNTTGTFTSLALQSGPSGATLPTFTTRLTSTPGGGAPSCRIDVSDPITVSGALVDYVIRIHYNLGGSVNSSCAVSWVVLSGVHQTTSWYATDSGSQAVTTNATPVTLTGAATTNNGSAFVIGALGLGGRELPFMTSGPTGGSWAALTQASGDHSIASANDSGIYVATETVSAGATFDNLTYTPVGGTERFMWIALRAAATGTVSGSAAFSLGAPTLAATGIRTTFAPAAFSLGALSLTGIGPAPAPPASGEFIVRRASGGSKLRTGDYLKGTVPSTNVGAFPLNGITVSATGVRTGVMHGAAGFNTLGTLGVAAVGQRTTFGHPASFALNALTVGATGTVVAGGGGGTKFGSASFTTLGGLTLAAVGNREVNGGVLLDQGNILLTAVGKRTAPGAGGFVLGALTIGAAGKRTGFGSAAFSLGTVRLRGRQAGYVDRTGQSIQVGVHSGISLGSRIGHGIHQ